MTTRLFPWLFGIGLLAASAGCQLFPVREQVDAAVCQTAMRAVDLQPLHHAGEHRPEAEGARDVRGRLARRDGGRADEPGDGQDAEKIPKPKGLDDEADEGDRKRPPADDLIPPGLPGGQAPPLRLPPAKTAKDRERSVEAAYPPLSPLPAPPALPAGPLGHPLALADFQLLALTNSPAVRQAAADVESAKGLAVQAGLCPNPTAGYEADSIGQASSAGLQGVFVEQTIRRGGKLRLAQARAEQEVRVAEVAYHRARFDLITQVRTAYFNVLAARESVRVSRSLAEFTDRVYAIQVDRVKAGRAALYEPAQLRVLAVQARNALAQARNREAAAWKSLAAAVGLPGIRPVQLLGRIDAPVPLYSYDALAARVLGHHTDVLSALAQIEREKVNLLLAQATPKPDVNLGFVAQRDNTTPPFGAVFNVRVGLTLPVWDKNQGNIMDAQARLERAQEGPHRARNELTGRLAEAFERYASNRTVVENYQRFILPDQVRAFRGAYDAHQADPNRVGFGEVVNAQQTLATAVTTYVSTLASMWQSAIDVAALLQTEDFLQVKDTFVPAPVPDLPAHRPCSPVNDPALRQPDVSWPGVRPEPRPAPAAEGQRPEQLPPPRKRPDEDAPAGNGGTVLRIEVVR